MALVSDFAPDSVYSILQAFQPFLKSFDVRTIAVRAQSGDEWENLVTSIKVSEKTVEEVEKEHSKLPKLRNNSIALFPSQFLLTFNILMDLYWVRLDVTGSEFLKAGVVLMGLCVLKQGSLTLWIWKWSHQGHGKWENHTVF